MGKSAAIVIAIAAIVFANCSYAQVASIPEVAEVQAKYDEKVRLDVLRPHELAVADLNAKFGAALERAQETAQKAGNLDDAIALKGEKEAVLAGPYMPLEDDAKTPASLKTMRSTYRAALGRLELDRDKRMRPLKDAYAKALEALMLTLTKGGRLEDAMALKKMREDLLVSTSASGAATPSGTGITTDPSGKTFSNSLGMKFVKVPGTHVLFCVHETRYKDYVAYAVDAKDVDGSWKDQKADGFVMERAEDHPVTRVSWEDAQKFCAWLSKKEGKTYRLPTDQEWSFAVGIGRDEKWTKDTTPATLVRSQTDFPWGDEWPPPQDAGNYSDQSRKEKVPAKNSQYLDGYDDGFPSTSPVMSFKPNKFGIYDLGGNVWEWCEDWFDSAKTDRVLRGSSWSHSERGNLLSSYRDHHKPDERIGLGFRIVLASDP